MMKRGIAFRISLIFLASAMSAMSVHAEEGALRFGLVPTESQPTLNDIWLPFFEDMS